VIFTRPRVRGWTLRGIVCQVVTWSEAHLPEVDAARAEFDQQERSWAPPPA